MSYAQHISTKATPQSEPVPGVAQVENSAGGFVFVIDRWKRLERFLILGAEGGTYYASEKKLTQENAGCVRECMAEDGARLVNVIVAISEAGRAPKNEPAIMALAMAAKLGDAKTRAHAHAVIGKVCRIGTHLFHFAEYVKALGGWGRGTKRAIGSWYTGHSVDSLALQAVKYQQRDGWSHRDLLRKSHPKLANDPARAAAFDWIVHDKQSEITHPLIGAFVEAQTLTKKSDLPRLLALITEHGLPHECVMNEMKKFPETWEAMLPTMGLTALIRNLGKMTNVEMLKPLSSGVRVVVERLADVAAMKKARIHPMHCLVALKTYESGRGEKGSLTWSPVPQIVEALNDAFYVAFDAVEPTGKPTLVGIDVSGSMSSSCSGVTSLSCREASVALAMVTIRTEQNSMACAFSAGAEAYGGRWSAGRPGFTPLSFGAKTRLDDAVRKASALPMGGTDCALPILYALENKIAAEVFHVITDNETWAGTIHPFQALRQYRDKTGIKAKLVVMAMTASPFTIADPSDAGMLDVVGFDTTVPAVVSDFARD